MRETRTVMGMPATVEAVGPAVTAEQLAEVFEYLNSVDENFSTYNETSEVSRLNAGLLPEEEWSADLRFVLAECERTRQETGGYFDIAHDGRLDPSGYVKGWAIQNSAALLAGMGFTDYYIEVAGDLQVAGNNRAGEPWTIGIRNPFQYDQIVKRVMLENMGMATSGTAARGQHIYDPHRPGAEITDIVSMTVIGPAVVDADRFATAAFAMGTEGISFIASQGGFEGYMIDAAGLATFTPGFTRYVLP